MANLKDAVEGRVRIRMLRGKGLDLPGGSVHETYLLPPPRSYISSHQTADVAELADALDSKSGTRKGVWVRPPPSAPWEQV